VRRRLSSVSTASELTTAISGCSGACTSTVITLTADITLSSCIVLTPSHNGLTIQSQSGNQYAVSGGGNDRPFDLQGSYGNRISSITFIDLIIKDGPDTDWGEENPSGNGPHSGGGVKIQYADSILFEGCTITDNVAGQTGGGVYGFRAFITFTNTDITDNKARTKGGGAYLKHCVTVFQDGAKRA